MERILKVSIDLFDKREIQEKHVLLDTTVQEENITYPTDPKLHKKIVEKCRTIAKDEGIKLRQRYKRTLKQIDRLAGRLPERGIVDRGYRGRKTVLGVEIRIPGKPKKNATNYEKQRARKFFQARAGIELVIGHVKHGHRMIIYYLSGTRGDMVITLLAAAGFNMMKIVITHDISVLKKSITIFNS